MIMANKSKNSSDEYDVVLFDDKLLDDLKKAIEKEHKEIIYAKKKTYPDKNKNCHKEKNNIEIKNFIDATLVRIGDTCKHLTEIKKNVKEDQFVFFDFMTCSETLLNCVSLLAEQFNADLSEFKKSKTVFRKDFQIGKTYEKCLEKKSKCKSACNEIDSDNNYFKYLRSLCSVHPTETTFHCRYILSSEEWCPYVEKFEYHPICRNNETWNYRAFVWAGNSQDSRIIDIFVPQIFLFVKMAYSQLMKITIDAVNNYYVDKLEELSKKHIPEIGECANILEYLDNLDLAVSERCGMEITYNVRYWKRIMKTEFSDPHMKDLLKQFKKAVIDDIESIRIKLQTMNIEEFFYTFSLPSSMDVDCSKLDQYSYERDKIWTYLGCKDIDEKLESIDEIRYDDPCPFSEGCFDQKNKDYLELCYRVRLQSYLKKFDELISNGANHEDLIMFEMSIYQKFGIKNNEWARIQLKIIEPVFGNCKFDYGDSNWNLYMQYCVAKWSIRD